MSDTSVILGCSDSTKLQVQAVKEHATPTAPIWTHYQKVTGSAGYAWKIVTGSWPAKSQ